MKKVDIVINQAPTSVSFTCPCCEEEFEIDYEEWVKRSIKKSDDMLELLVKLVNR